KIQQLKVYNFTFKQDPKKMPHTGVIAQDLQKIFPNSVIKGEDGYLVIRWDEMFYAMINAVKELAAKINIIDSRVTRLEKENAELRARLLALEKKLK
ncbi:tail fiber domain-containing protein, partial [bacterium]|nr:tail fiber domain-containing protein [bacterium]